MRGVILGSGIVGLVAKEVLSGHWDVIPFRRSRFYSYATPLADNFLVRDKDLDGLVGDLGGGLVTPFYRRCYSHQGHLISRHDPAICAMWLDKVFGGQAPAHSEAYWSKRLTLPVYDLRTNKLYERLLSKCLPMLVTESKRGDVTEVGDHFFVRGGKREDFDYLISTIPLNMLMSLMGRPAEFRLLPLHFINLESSLINLEGHNQALVADYALDFFKVTALAPRNYLFYSTREIVNPGAYLLNVIGPADVIDGTAITDALPIGDIPDLSVLEDQDVFCVGALAQHDAWADVSSNFLRLIRFAQRGYHGKDRGRNPGKT